MEFVVKKALYNG